MFLPQTICVFYQQTICSKESSFVSFYFLHNHISVFWGRQASGAIKNLGHYLELESEQAKLGFRAFQWLS